MFGIHPLTTEDITTEYSREKIEVFDNYVFIIVDVCAGWLLPSPPFSEMESPFFGKVSKGPSMRGYSS